MSTHKNLQEYIDRYRAGDIPEGEFRRRLDADAQLREEYGLYQRDLEVIRAAARERLRAKAALVLEEHEQKTVRILPVKRILQLAAALVFILTAYFVIQNMIRSPGAEALFAQHFELPAPSGERNDNPDAEKWNEAMVAYSHKDYDQTIEILTPLTEQNDFIFPDRAKLFLGLSHLVRNENEKAVALFASISPESSYWPDAEWYLALTYLNMEKLVEAREAFQQIVKQPRHFKREAALDILKNL